MGPGVTKQFRDLPGARFEGVSVYRTRKVVFGQERTVVMTFNEALLEGQLQGITANLEKAKRKLTELQAKLRRHRQGSAGDDAEQPCRRSCTGRRQPR